MPRPIERTFDHRKPLLVRRQFKSAGRTLSPGEPFPWQRLALDVRRVRLLYEGGYVGHTDDELMPEAVEPTEASAPTEASEPTEASAPSERDADLAVDSLAALQNIASAEGAPIKTSKTAQREAIVELRNSKS